MKSPFPFPGTFQQYLQHLSVWIWEGGFVGDFLDMTMVCSDCVPAGTRARAGMALGNQIPWCGDQCVWGNLHFSLAKGRLQRPHKGPGEGSHGGRHRTEHLLKEIG